MNTRYKALLLLIIALLCAGCGTVANPPATANTTNALRARPTPGGSTSTTNTTSTTSRSGDMVLTSGLDDNGCAIGSITRFETTDAIYVVVRAASVAEGTSFFARLYEGNTTLEDTEEVVADQAYSDVCVNFEFKPRQGVEWDTGDYEIEFFVNGNSYHFIDFEIR